ncbi:hypothetical protein [Cytobacillus firmus]|uniref:hypothetical protein n=1 Tax=Cytobacillus firmus TaxID=1399 RepID=UPI0021622C52|nr:hypothetical protein [Cytobacillus firmus]MCS0674635.1 hypothetical protein [Cytobacillus firmus]
MKKNIFLEEDPRVVVHIKDGKVEVVTNPENKKVYIVNFDLPIIEQLQDKLGSKEQEHRCSYCLQFSSVYDWSIATLQSTFLTQGNLAEAIYSVEHFPGESGQEPEADFFCPKCFQKNLLSDISYGAKYRGKGRWK